MGTERALGFLKSLIGWVVSVAILQGFAHISGWTEGSVINNTIGLTIGWMIWEGIAWIRRRFSNKV